MRHLLVPPEVRDLTEGSGLPRTTKPTLWTPERLTLASMLAVTLTVTASYPSPFLPTLLPCTALVMVAFWHFGRRVKRPGPMFGYCFAVGALAGVANAWSTVLLGAVVTYDDRLNLTAFAIAALIGATFGIVYGAAYLPPMLAQLSARSCQRSEGIDRCLQSHGLWGVAVLCIPLALCVFVAPSHGALDVLFVLTYANMGVHALMFSVGLVRRTRRRWWVQRVLAGKVPGWLVCEQERFEQAELQGLAVFWKPALPEGPSIAFSVLARNATGETGDAYRAARLVPKFLVAEARPWPDYLAPPPGTSPPHPA